MRDHTHHGVAEEMLGTRALPSRIQRQLLPSAAYVVPDARIALLPFQFPSPDHLDDAVRDALLMKVDVDGESERTTAWRQDGYQSLRRFLRDSGSESAFLAGDHRRQKRILQEWIGALRRAGRSHSTVNGYCRSVAGTFLSVSIRTGMASPMLGFDIPKAGEARAPRLHARRVEELLQTTKHIAWRSDLERTRNVALVGLLAFTGLRRQELLDLQNGDVHLETGYLLIRKGKGRHGGMSREVIVPPFFRSALAEYTLARARARRETPSFLVSTRRDSGIGPTAVKHVLRRVGSRMGVHLSPHMLRRTCEDWMRLKKVAPLIAMRQLGHRSVAMLLRYSETTPEEQADALADIDSA